MRTGIQVVLDRMITIINLTKGICRYKNEEISRYESGGGEASEFIHHKTAGGKLHICKVVQGSLGPGQPRGPSAFWVVTSRPGLHRSCYGCSSNPVLFCSHPHSCISFLPSNASASTRESAGWTPSKVAWNSLLAPETPGSVSQVLEG